MCVCCQTVHDSSRAWVLPVTLTICEAERNGLQGRHTQTTISSRQLLPEGHEMGPDLRLRCS